MDCSDWRSYLERTTSAKGVSLPAAAAKSVGKREQLQSGVGAVMRLLSGERRALSRVFSNE